jgi:hypothetical protein
MGRVGVLGAGGVLWDTCHNLVSTTFYSTVCGGRTVVWGWLSIYGTYCKAGNTNVFCKNGPGTHWLTYSLKRFASSLILIWASGLSWFLTIILKHPITHTQKSGICCTAGYIASGRAHTKLPHPLSLSVAQSPARARAYRAQGPRRAKVNPRLVGALSACIREGWGATLLQNLLCSRPKFWSQTYVFICKLRVN